MKNLSEDKVIKKENFAIYISLTKPIFNQLQLYDHRIIVYYFTRKKYLFHK